jgi:hypothetical protein
VALGRAGGVAEGDGAVSDTVETVVAGGTDDGTLRGRLRRPCRDKGDVERIPVPARVPGECVVDLLEDTGTMDRGGGGSATTARG